METKKLKSLKKVNDDEERIDLEQFIIDSQNVKYREEIKKKFKVDKKGTISKKDFLEILEKYKNSKSGELIECLSESDNESIVEVKQEKSLKEKFIDAGKSLFNYAGKKFSYIIADDKIFFKGKEIAEYLEYADTKQAVYKNVDEDERINLENIQKLGGVYKTPLTWNEKNTIYVSEPGFYK